MPKAMSIVTQCSPIFGHESVRNDNGNASRCRVVVTFDDGTSQEIFVGEEFNPRAYRKNRSDYEKGRDLQVNTDPPNPTD
ncbi:MAG: hypothetical protein V1778_02190 [bacterium]